MKLADIIDPEFVSAITELASKPVSMAVAYKLTDLLEKVKQENEKFQNMRVKLLQKYGAKNKDGSIKKNKEGTSYLIDDKPAFEKEYAELIAVEVTLPAIKIDDIKDLKLTTRAVSKLKAIITP